MRLLLICLLAPILISAQTISPIDPYGPAPGRSGPRLTFKIDDHGRLVVEHHDVMGIVQRDLVQVEALDRDAIHIDTHLGSIILTCSTGFKHCIHSTLYRKDMDRRSSMLLLPVHDGEAPDTMLNEIMDLLRGAEAMSETNTHLHRSKATEPTKAR